MGTNSEEQGHSQMEGKRILITGASGFIGSTIVDKAIGKGYETWAGIRASSSRQYLQDERIHFIDLPYHDKAKLKEQLEEITRKQGRFDYIVHVAGVTKALRKTDFDRVNFEYTRNFVDALIELEILPDTFVLMSSLSALGVGDETGYTPIGASHVPNPNTVYGRSKLKAEEYLKGLADFPYLILRPTGVYGPRDSDYFILMKAVQNGLNASVGYRKQLLSFIYSEDLADAIFLLLEKGVTREEFVVSDGDCYTDTEFNTIVQEALQRRWVFRLKIPLFLIRPAAYLSEKIAALFGKATAFNSDKYHIMKQRNWVCDISPLHEAIGFEPKYRLKEGVAKTVAWYKERGWLR